jgi:hypothetical protein
MKVQRRALWWTSALALVALATFAAVAAAPPNLTKAIEAQRRLAAERPRDAGVFNDLGNLLLLVHQPDDAETAYRHAVELDPNKVSALFNLALLEQGKGALKDAASLFKRVLQADPRHAWAHYQLGSIYEAWGKEGSAIDEYAQSFALDPQLAFPEVNPHVVDNKLVTQAMLRAYRSDFAPPQAPKLYDEPARIAALMVTRPQPKDAAPAAAAPNTPAPAARPGVPSAAAPKGTGANVIRARDLDQGPAPGQALPSGTTARSPYTGGVRATVPGQQPERTLREWNRPEPQPVPGEGVAEEDGTQPAPVVAPPPAVYYRPGLPSSSRLEIQTVPGGAVRGHTRAFIRSQLAKR